MQKQRSGGNSNRDNMNFPESTYYVTRFDFFPLSFGIKYAIASLFLHGVLLVGLEQEKSLIFFWEDATENVILQFQKKKKLNELLKCFVCNFSYKKILRLLLENFLNFICFWFIIVGNKSFEIF